jgi:hypothetical protein
METLEVSWMDQRIQSTSTSLGCPALLGETLVVLDTSHLFGHHILAANGGTGLKYILFEPVKKRAMIAMLQVNGFSSSLARSENGPATRGTNEVAGFLEERLRFFWADTTA